MSDSLVQIGRSAAAPFARMGAQEPHPFRVAQPPQVRPAAAQSAHRLRVGPLPEYPRVLPSRRRDVHDPRQLLHARLRLLLRAQRQSGQARHAPRPRRARQRRAHGRGDALEVRRDHQRQSRRPRRRRLAPLRRDRPRSPPRAARRPASKCSRPISAAISTPSRASSMPARTSSITTWRPCRGSTRACARRPTTGSRSTCWRSRKRSLDGARQIRLHGRARRDRAGGARAAARSARAGNRRRHHRPISPAHAPQSARRRLHRPRAVRRLPRLRPRRSASRPSSAARWCAAPTWPTRSAKKRSGHGPELGSGAALGGAADPHFPAILDRLVCARSR